MYLASWLRWLRRCEVGLTKPPKSGKDTQAKLVSCKSANHGLMGERLSGLKSRGGEDLLMFLSSSRNDLTLAMVLQDFVRCGLVVRVTWPERVAVLG